MYFRFKVVTVGFAGCTGRQLGLNGSSEEPCTDRSGTADGMYRTDWMISPNRASDCMGTYRHQNESLNSFVNRPKHISSHLQGTRRLKKPFMPHETWKPNFGKRTVHFYWTHVQSPGTRVCGSERPVDRLLTGRRVFKTTRSLPKYGSTFETEVVVLVPQTLSGWLA